MTDFWRIHQQHKDLFDLLERINVCMLESEGQEDPRVPWLRVLAHLAQHFLQEEMVLERLGFSGREAHRREHSSILHRFSSFLDRADLNPSEFRGPEYVDLQKAILEHQQVSDRNWMDALGENAS